MKKAFTNATVAIGIIMLIMAFLVTLQIKSVIYNYSKDPTSSMRPNELLVEINNLRNGSHAGSWGQRQKGGDKPDQIRKAMGLDRK